MYQIVSKVSKYLKVSNSITYYQKRIRSIKVSNSIKSIKSIKKCQKVSKVSKYQSIKSIKSNNKKSEEVIARNNIKDNIRTKLSALQNNLNTMGCDLIVFSLVMVIIEFL